MEPIKELSRHTLAVDVTKEDGTADLPSKITWRIDAINGSQTTEIMADTEYIPTEPSFNLVIPATLNRVTTGQDVERRRVTVIADGLAATEYTYYIKRLKGLA